MKRRTATPRLVAAACVLAASAALAQSSPRPGVDRPGPSPLLLALQLAERGQRLQDPWALLMSARLLNHLGLQPSTARVESPPAPLLPLQAKPLLQQARAWAAARADASALLPLIDDELVAGARGTDAGDRIAHTVIGPGRALRLHLRYVGGQRASFRVEAVNPAFVRLSVQGPGGPVCQPSREAESISCVWRPPSDTDVVVEAEALGEIEQALAYRHN